MKIKIFKFIACLIFILMQLMPTVHAIEKEIEKDLQTFEKEDTKEENNIDTQNNLIEELDIEINENETVKNNDEEQKVEDIEKEENIKIERQIEILENVTVRNEQIEEFTINFNINGTKINSYFKDEINYLFIPKGIDLLNLEIDYTGNIESIDGAIFNSETQKIYGEFEDNSEFAITLHNGEIKKVKIMQSDVPAIFINDLTSKDDPSDEPITIQDVNSGSKDIKYDASVMVTGCENDKSNISQIVEFKGRGNTSWRDMPKKGYQIKLNKKNNLLEIGNSNEKKWVLIANYQDPTLLKNKIINDLCVQSKLSSCPNSSYADLYVDGNYVGNYLVCDKIEIKKNRINLTDDKGVLVELDNAYYDEEDYYFKSNRGFYYVIKEFVNEENSTVAIESFKNALNKFEAELYSENPSWNKITKMIDVESFAKYYLIDEFAENNDSYWTSTYMYKDGDNDVIHIGPTWDYDAAFAYCKGKDRGENPFVDFTLNYKSTNVMKYLYKFPQFATLVNEIYVKDIKPNLDKIDVYNMSKEFEKSLNINTLVWYDTASYTKLKRELNTFIENRKLYYNTRYSNKQIEYSTHIENIGWTNSVNSTISGTEGKSLRLEGIRISLGSIDEEKLSISYKTHVQNIGWQDWVNDGEMAGTTGQSLRLEAIAIKLNNSSNYSVKYRVHVQDYGWQDWVNDGEIAGTTGQSLRLEAIEIQIVPKCNYIGKLIKDSNEIINYKGHIQKIGDTGYGSNGEIIGTIGRSLRLEAIKIELRKDISDKISLEIDEHIENIGWKYGLTEKEYIGTTGQSLRLEAIAIKLKNSTDYSIEYRVHVQNIGWQEWKKNGEIAGTTGQGLRIEAIQIELKRI